MAAVFQSNVFQANVFQVGAAAGHVFQCNVFQNNVFQGVCGVTPPVVTPSGGGGTITRLYKRRKRGETEDERRARIYAEMDGPIAPVVAPPIVPPVAPAPVVAKKRIYRTFAELPPIEPVQFDNAAAFNAVARALEVSRSDTIAFLRQRDEEEAIIALLLSS